MEILNIKTPEDVLEYMKEHIVYGWKDKYGLKHIKSMGEFRNNYRTMSLEESLELGIGTCIEQVLIMKYLLEIIGIESKMYCTRVYEGYEEHKRYEDVKLHCFILYNYEDKIYQIEYPNWDRAGLYSFESVEDAIRDINIIYEAMSGGHALPVTEFSFVPENISFKQFNLFLNNIDKNKTRTRK